VPVRFVAGGRDAYVPHAAVEVTAGFLPEGAVVELPDASHWLMLEEPRRIAEVLLGFFAADGPAG
jgi:pimeloyl-ACP methyl ester carboxylesterase